MKPTSIIEHLRLTLLDINGFMYLIQFYKESKTIFKNPICQIYKTTINKWTRIPILSFPRQFHSCASLPQLAQVNARSFRFFVVLQMHTEHSTSQCSCDLKVWKLHQLYFLFSGPQNIDRRLQNNCGVGCRTVHTLCPS